MEQPGVLQLATGRQAPSTKPFQCSRHADPPGKYRPLRWRRIQLMKASLLARMKDCGAEGKVGPGCNRLGLEAMRCPRIQLTKGCGAGGEEQAGGRRMGPALFVWAASLMEM